MRVSTQSFYKNFNNNFSSNMENLNKYNTQIASGKKLINTGDDSIAYTNVMTLNYESIKLEQTEKISSIAKTDTYNTDRVLSDFTTALTSFKTDLLKAGNAVNSKESRMAIASNLRGIKNHLQTLANTSIAGKYIFAGTNTSTQPISNDGTYNGNDQNIKAVVGNNNTIQYNINGADLFVGRDDEYSKVVSTNVVQYNKSKLHPQIDPNVTINRIVRDEILSAEVYLKPTDTIRDMLGDNDNNLDNDKDPVFFIRGIKANNTSFSEKIKLSSDATVDDLLKKIEDIYGNTNTNKVVDVSLNETGQIEIKDLKEGRDKLKFNIFAAVDRSYDLGVNRADTNVLENLISSSSVEIIELTKSNVSPLKSFHSVVGVEDSYTHNQINIKTNFGENTSRETTMRSVLGDNIDSIELEGKTTAGNTVNITLNIGANTTFNDFINQIENSYGSAKVEFSNGKMIILDTSLQPEVEANTSTMEIAFSAFSGGVPAKAFEGSSAMNYDKNSFIKIGNTFSSNVSQVVKNTNTIATNNTKLAEVAGIIDTNANGFGNEMNGRNLHLEITDIHGNTKKIEFEMLEAGSKFKIDANLDGIYEQSFDILDSNGIATPAQELTYKQLFDVIAMGITGNIPLDDDLDTAISYEEYTKATQIASTQVDVYLDSKGQMTIRDKISSESKINFGIYDSTVNDFSSKQGSILSFTSNDTMTTQQSQVDIFNDLEQMILAVEEGITNPDSDSKYLNNIGLNNHIHKIDHIMEHVSKRHTTLGSYSNELQNSEERSQVLQVNIAQMKSQIEDVDLAEVLLNFQQTQIAYQAVLSTSAKINGMSLLNYM